MNRIDHVRVGKNIRAYRLQRGLTQEQLAEACHVSPGYIGLLERDERVFSLFTLTYLCLALDIKPNDLLEDTIYNGKNRLLDSASMEFITLTQQYALTHDEEFDDDALSADDLLDSLEFGQIVK